MIYYDLDFKLIVYLKSNDDYEFRVVQHYPHKKVGEYTSMNWLIVDIQHYSSSKGCFISYKKYKKECELKISILNKKQKRIDNLKNTIDVIYKIFH